MFELQINKRITEEAKQQFASLPLPALLLPNVVSGAWAKQLRSKLPEDGWVKMALAHRGLYLYNDSTASPALLRDVQSLVQEIAGQPLSLRGVRWCRFSHRSYSLLRDDLPDLEASPNSYTIEVQLDLSEEPVEDVELVYCHRRQPYFVVPARPGSLSIVARGAMVQRYQRYLTHLVGEKRLTRLEARFAALPLRSRCESRQFN